MVRRCGEWLSRHVIGDLALLRVRPCGAIYVVCGGIVVNNLVGRRWWQSPAGLGRRHEERCQPLAVWHLTVGALWRISSLGVVGADWHDERGAARYAEPSHRLPRFVACFRMRVRYPWGRPSPINVCKA